MKSHLLRVFPYFILVTTVLALLSTSEPFSAGDRSLQAAFRAQALSDQPPPEWQLPPHPNSTHHLIFRSVSGLLQRWSNTLRRNGALGLSPILGLGICQLFRPSIFARPGHNIVPATIPAGTILYHGRSNDQVPDVPEWLAFDFEHAYLFCRGACYVLSLQAKRDLRLVYFDGSSAAKMKDGPLDSQDIVGWGKPQSDKFFSERERINALCDWGRPFGLDGFIRMEFHLCVSRYLMRPRRWGLIVPS
jgi:hypothetical protein